MVLDVAQFEHLGSENVGRGDVGDALRLSKQGPDLAAVVAAEVAAYSLTEIGGLADVQDLVVCAAEQIDARLTRQGVGHAQLGGLRVGADAGEGDQVVEPQYAEPGGTFEQEVQKVGGGQGIVEGAVRRSMIEAKARCQRAESAIRHLVADQSPGQRQGVDDGIRDLGIATPAQGGIDEGHVEPDVVADHHGVAQELDHRREYGVDRRGAHHHRFGDPGEHGDHRRDRPARVDQALQRAQALAAANLDHADLGDQVGVAIAAGGLDVEHAERDIGKRYAEIVEGTLPAGCKTHRPSPPRTNVRCQEQAFDLAGRGGLGTVERVSGETPADVPDQALQAALELAVGIAAAGVKLRPPLAFPPALKKFLKFHKLPPPAFAEVRAAVEADDGFRQRLASVATSELVDEVGMLWLSRPEGWSAAIAELLPHKVDDDETMIDASGADAWRPRTRQHGLARRSWL